MKLFCQIGNPQARNLRYARESDPLPDNAGRVAENALIFIKLKIRCKFVQTKNILNSFLFEISNSKVSIQKFDQN